MEREFPLPGARIDAQKRKESWGPNNKTQEKEINPTKHFSNTIHFLTVVFGCVAFSLIASSGYSGAVTWVMAAYIVTWSLSVITGLLKVKKSLSEQVELCILVFSFSICFPASVVLTFHTPAHLDKRITAFVTGFFLSLMYVVQVYQIRHIIRNIPKGFFHFLTIVFGCTAFSLIASSGYDGPVSWVMASYIISWSLSVITGLYKLANNLNEQVQFTIIVLSCFNCTLASILLSIYTPLTMDRRIAACVFGFLLSLTYAIQGYQLKNRTCIQEINTEAFNSTLNGCIHFMTIVLGCTAFSLIASSGYSGAVTWVMAAYIISWSLSVLTAGLNKEFSIVVFSFFNCILASILLTFYTPMSMTLDRRMAACLIGFRLSWTYGIRGYQLKENAPKSLKYLLTKQGVLKSVICIFGYTALLLLVTARQWCPYGSEGLWIWTITAYSMNWAVSVLIFVLYISGWVMKFDSRHVDNSDNSAFVQIEIWCSFFSYVHSFAAGNGVIFINCYSALVDSAMGFGIALAVLYLLELKILGAKRRLRVALKLFRAFSSCF